MADGTPTPTKAKTGKFVRQGQTAGAYGNDPSKTTAGVAAQCRDLTP
jgi:hypothetical protein